VLEVPQRRMSDDLVTQQPMSGPTVDFNRLPPLDVLVVDDVAWNRDLVTAYLANSHHRVRQADDGQLAVEEVRRLRPDVVLMDLRMPRMSGEQALLRIKSDPDSAQVPVIAVTASSMSAEESWLRDRFDGYVRKPFSRADLFAALAAHFEAAPPAVEASEPVVEPLSPVPGRVDAKALAQLRHLYSEDIPSLRGHLRMREAGGLAEQLARIAATLDWPRLGEHARSLAGAVESFDVPAIRKLLDDCPMPEVANDE
jgi:CheY-like chemotaxis protein